MKHRMLVLMAVLCLLQGLCELARAVEPVLASSAGPLDSGRTYPLEVLFLNSSSEPVNFIAPATLYADFASVTGTEPVTLERSEADQISHSLAPGSFHRATYLLSLLPSQGSSGFIVNLRLNVVTTAPIALGSNNGAQPQPATRTDSSTSATATGPASDQSPLSLSPPTANPGGLVETVAGNLSAHEPMYFLAGNEDPLAKFQVSLKYRLFNPNDSLAKKVPLFTGFHLAYSQTSFWDIAGESAPFFDSSYRPEVLFVYEDPKPGRWPIVSRIDFLAGVQHESNGKAGDDSRSLNVAYIRPVITFGDKTDLFLTISPRIVGYIGNIDDNPDIKDYRGYGDLRVVLGQGSGLQLAAIGRIGDDWDKGSLELDLTYPLHRIFFGNFDLYLQAQYFTGFGESLIRYNEQDSSFRIGLGVVR